MQRKGEEELSWSYGGIAWSFISWPFRGAIDATTHVASTAMTRAAQLPGKAVAAVGAVKESVLPSYDPQRYRQEAEKVRQRQEERKRVSYLIAAPRVEPQETTGLLEDIVFPANIFASEAVARKKPAAGEKPAAEEKSVAAKPDADLQRLLTRIELRIQDLENLSVTCCSLFACGEAAIKAKKAAALTRVSTAKSWSELKMKVEAELNGPEANIVKQGFFSHQTKDLLEECQKTANAKLTL